MKVRCIGDGDWYILNRTMFWGLIKLPNKRTVGPDYGDVVTVTREYYAYGEKYYDLLEWPPKSDDDGFDATFFIPIDETIDETEFERNYKKQLV